MRAWWYDTAGDAVAVLTRGESDAPAPDAGEVRVRVARSAVNPTDTKRRASGRELGTLGRIVPNNDGAGVIDAVGAGVDKQRLGQRVWIFGAQHARSHGTAAEFCTVPSAYAQPLPDSVSMADGACLGVPAVTAYAGLFSDGPIAGLTVLVTGGAGRVGRYAVQMAKHAGARVVATAGNDANLDICRDLGADHAINYRDAYWAGAIRDALGGDGVDRVVEVEFGANIEPVLTTLNPNAVVASYASDAVGAPALPFLQLMYNNTTVKAFSIYGMPAGLRAESLAAVSGMIDPSGTGVSLRHAIDRVLPFEDLIAAHQAVEAGATQGAVQLDIDGSL